MGTLDCVESFTGQGKYTLMREGKWNFIFFLQSTKYLGFTLFEACKELKYLDFTLGKQHWDCVESFTGQGKFIFFKGGKMDLFFLSTKDAPMVTLLGGFGGL